MEETLLQKVQKVEKRNGRKRMDNFEERLELALAYLRGEVSNLQIQEVLNLKGGAQSYLASTIFMAIKDGKIKITKV